MPSVAEVTQRPRQYIPGGMCSVRSGGLENGSCTAPISLYRAHALGAVTAPKFPPVETRRMRETQ